MMDTALLLSEHGDNIWAAYQAAAAKRPGLDATGQAALMDQQIRAHLPDAYPASDIRHLRGYVFAAHDAEEPQPMQRRKRQQRLITAGPVAQDDDEPADEYAPLDLPHDLDTWNVGYNFPSFVRCGLPYRPQDELDYVRYDGNQTLLVVGSKKWGGVPYGRDRFVPLMLASIATKTQSRDIYLDNLAGAMRMVGLPAQSGADYQHMQESLKRVFAATVFFGEIEPGSNRETWDRYHVADQVELRELRDYPKDWRRDAALSYKAKTGYLPQELFRVRLSRPFWDVVQGNGEYVLPVDLAVIRRLPSTNFGAIDLCQWLTWRSFNVPKGDMAEIPLIGKHGLVNQMGTADSNPRRFRERVAGWLQTLREVWPNPRRFPASLDTSARNLLLVKHSEIIPKRQRQRHDDDDFADID